MCSDPLFFWGLVVYEIAGAKPACSPQLLLTDNIKERSQARLFKPKALWSFNVNLWCNENDENERSRRQKNSREEWRGKQVIKWKKRAKLTKSTILRRYWMTIIGSKLHLGESVLEMLIFSFNVIICWLWAHLIAQHDKKLYPCVKVRNMIRNVLTERINQRVFGPMQAQEEDKTWWWWWTSDHMQNVCGCSSVLTPADDALRVLRTEENPEHHC